MKQLLLKASASCILLLILLRLDPSSAATLETNFKGTSGQAGIMFDLQTITSKSITVDSMQIHTELTSNFDVQVWTRKGTMIEFEKAPVMWTKAMQRNVLGKGYGMRTSLGGFNLAKVTLQPNSTHALYVTIITGNQTSTYLRFTDVESGTGSIYTQDAYLRLLVGKGKRPNFGRNVLHKGFNGALVYSVVTNPVTPAPTVKKDGSTPVEPVNQTLTSTMSYTDGNAGIMFDMKSKFQALSVTSFDIHTSETKAIVVEIYTKDGTLVGSERVPMNWSKLNQLTVQGMGVGQRTSLGNTMGNVYMKPSSVKAFYITMQTTCQVCPLLKYLKSSKPTGSTYKENNYLSMLVGKGKRYKFGRNINNMIFSGVVYYTISTGSGGAGTSSTPAPVAPSPITDAFGGLITTKEFDRGQAGVMFDIQSRTLVTVTITGVEVVLSKTGSTPMEVWVTDGGMSGKDRTPASWTKLMQASFIAQGAATLTPITFTSTTSIVNGGRMGIYITQVTSCKTCNYLKFLSTTKKTGDIYISNSYLHIFVGKGKRYSFGRNVDNVVMTGKVNYTIQGMEKQPSQKPSNAPSVSNKPTTTGKPSRTPSLSPTFCNSKLPTSFESRDHQALMYLFNKTNGCSWTWHNNWGTSDHVCTWYGVICDSNKRVISLSLINNNLNGPLPPEISSLDQLLSLSLSNNSLSGAVPSTISEMYNLVTLRIDNNKLTGTVTAAMCYNLSTMWADCFETVSIDSSCKPKTTCFGNSPSTRPSQKPSHVKSPKPSMVPSRRPTPAPSSRPSRDCNDSDQGRAIKALYDGFKNQGALNTAKNPWFQGGCICGAAEIPEVPPVAPSPGVPAVPGTEKVPAVDPYTGITCDNVGITGKVTELSIKGKLMDGTISTMIGKLTSLEILDFSSNSFSGTFPRQITGLTALKQVKLQSNKFTGTFPREMYGLRSATLLNISKNSFNGTFPTHIGVLTALETLEIQSNSFTSTIPYQIGQANQLNTVMLNNNKFTQLPPQFGQLTNIKKVNMSKNMIAKSLPTEIGQLTLLEELNLASNSFTSTVATQMGLLTALTKLNLHNNSFKGLLPTQLGSLVSIDDFTLQTNSFTGLLPTQINALVKVTKLQLQSNSFSGIVPTIAALVDLKTLDLSNNSFTEFAADLNTMTSLEKLYLQNNVALHGVQGGDIWSLFSNASLDTLKTVNLCGITSATALTAMTADECRYTWGTLTVTGGSANCKCSAVNVSPDPCSSAC